MIEFIFLGLFIVIIGVISVLMLRDKIIFKLGVRNITKRKGYAVIVILGLMVGTGVISSSLVIGDTMNNMIESEILKSLYTTDEVIQGLKPTGEADYFNESIFYDLDGRIDKEYIDGLSPQISDHVAVLNLDTNLSEPSISFIGVDFDRAQNFGSFIDQKGEGVTSLGANQMMIGDKVASDLDAEVGQKVTIFGKTMKTFTITYILKEEERAGAGDSIYVSLNVAQEVLNKNGLINQILISNRGGVYEGMDYTDNVKSAFEKAQISNSLEFKIVQTKEDVLEDGKKNIQQLSSLFTVFGTFSVIAGVILIINIFVMLAEERKSEMGMARAVGMQRKHLKRMYLGEGTVYALIASFVGVFFGIGIGYILIFLLEEILKSFGTINILKYFTFTQSSLIIGYVSGFLITIFTIYLTSNRISKLNIVRAIRNIPEPTIPRSDKKMLRTGLLVFAGGLLLLFLGVGSEQMAPFFSGISLMIFGAGLISRRWVGDKIALNLTGILIFILWVIPRDYFPHYSSGMEMFIVSGIFLVFAALLLVMVNSDKIIKGLTFLIGRGKSGQAVTKTAVSYALKSKFRTGMTIAIFALVIFTITTMSMIIGMMGTNIEKQVQEASGGYEVLGFTSPNLPIDNITEELKDKGLDSKIEKYSALVSGNVNISPTLVSGETIYYSIIGVDDNFIEENEFYFSKSSSEYGSEKDLWYAIRDNESLVVIDGSFGAQNNIVNTGGRSHGNLSLDVGDTIKIIDKNNSIVEKKVIGILDTTIIQGIFSYNAYVEEEFNINTSTVFLFSIKQGQNADAVSKEIESSFLKNGMQTIVVKTVVMNALNAMNQFFYLFDAFMALGLIIGIAGLGIITIRSVHERRQEIGMMRAIGFKKRMVLSSFIIETSTIAIIGILIGTFLGIFTGYIIWRDSFSELGFDFIINWQPIILISFIAFVFTLICILPASRKASRIPPAEALRYE
jgi:putative ABC transport system permease protein